MGNTSIFLSSTVIVRSPIHAGIFTSQSAIITLEFFKKIIGYF